MSCPNVDSTATAGTKFVSASSNNQNHISRLVALYALLNEALTLSKQTSELIKQGDKETVQHAHKHRERLAIGQCGTELVLGFMAAMLTPISENGRTFAEIVNKISSGLGSVWGDNIQRATHLVQTSDKKIDAAGGRKQSMMRIEEELRRSYAEAMRNTKKTFEGKVAD